MISHQSAASPTPRAMRIERFGEVPTKATPRTPSRITAGRILVRVTHASVGATDVTAARGDYLMQPLPRFVPGYDFIGTVERLGATKHPYLSAGQRVAGVLPRMGAHATFVTVAPSLLVPVPDELDSAVALRRRRASVLRCSDATRVPGSACAQSPFSSWPDERPTAARWRRCLLNSLPVP